LAQKKSGGTVVLHKSMDDLTKDPHKKREENGRETSGHRKSRRKGAKERDHSRGSRPRCCVLKEKKPENFRRALGKRGGGKEVGRTSKSMAGELKKKK